MSFSGPSPQDERIESNGGAKAPTMGSQFLSALSMAHPLVGALAGAGIKAIHGGGGASDERDWSEMTPGYLGASPDSNPAPQISMPDQSMGQDQSSLIGQNAQPKSKGLFAKLLTAMV